MTGPEETSDTSWSWLNWSIVLVFTSAVIMISLISAGIFDPKPIGKLARSVELEQQALESGEHRLTWLEQGAPPAGHSIRLTAALADGEIDSAYGLVVGDEEQHIVVAVSPVGYLAIQRYNDQEIQKLIPWQTWPHVAHENEVNELWLDIEGDALASVRINREILWQGTEPVPGRQIGLWAESFGGSALFDFQHLEIFSQLSPDQPPSG